MRIFLIILSILLSNLLLINRITAQETNIIGNGCLFDSARYANIPMSAPLVRGNYNLPASASMRAFCPIPQDQGSSGTCTAWSTSYASRTILYSQRKKLSPTEINTNAFSPSYVYNQIRLTNDCSYGAYISDALDLLKSQGCITYKEFGFECSRNVTDKEKKKAKDFMIRDYKRLFVYDGTARAVITPIKKSLSENKPVVISMRCFGSLEKAKDVWNPPANASTDTNKGFHAMTVIGYDDTKFGGAFELMNSWGAEWGNNGFVWIRYTDFQKNCMEAYEISDGFVEPSKPAFTGEMSFKLQDGKLMETTFQQSFYQMKQPYYSGTTFQFYLTHTEPTYLYVIGTDKTGKCSMLFPFDKTISPYLSYKTGTIAFPDEDHFIRLDNKKGTDYICAFYSKAPIRADELMKKMEAMQGDITQKVYAALGIKSTEGIEYYKMGNKTGFKVNKHFAVGSVVPLIVAIEHK
jgi:Papain family cysteine protease/Domain of unknown function (DUF4384)